MTTARSKSLQFTSSNRFIELNGTSYSTSTASMWPDWLIELWLVMQTNTLKFFFHLFFPTIQFDEILLDYLGFFQQSDECKRRLAYSTNVKQAKSRWEPVWLRFNKDHFQGRWESYHSKRVRLPSLCRLSTDSSIQTLQGLSLKYRKETHDFMIRFLYSPSIFKRSILLEMIECSEYSFAQLLKKTACTLLFSASDACDASWNPPVMHSAPTRRR